MIVDRGQGPLVEDLHQKEARGFSCAPGVASGYCIIVFIYAGKVVPQILMPPTLAQFVFCICPGGIYNHGS